MYYSPETKGFYSDEVNSVIPSDAVEITDEYWMELLVGQQNGKLITSDANGRPVLTDQPPLTQDQLVAQADVQKKALINAANNFMNNKQWPGKAAMGRLNDSEKTQYNAWLDYLDELEAVEINKSPNIVWPTSPA